MNESILWKKSRCRWIKDGDTNSKYFHAVINKRRRFNATNGVSVGNEWAKDPKWLKGK